jgi:hypothetical protein
VIALHERDPRGYRELAVAPLGWRALLAVLVRSLGFAVNLAIGLPGWCGNRSAMWPARRFGPPPTSPESVS